MWFRLTVVLWWGSQSTAARLWATRWGRRWGLTKHTLKKKNMPTVTSSVGVVSSVPCREQGFILLRKGPTAYLALCLRPLAKKRVSASCLNLTHFVFSMWFEGNKNKQTKMRRLLLSFEVGDNTLLIWQRARDQHKTWAKDILHNRGPLNEDSSCQGSERRCQIEWAIKMTRASARLMLLYDLERLYQSPAARAVSHELSQIKTRPLSHVGQGGFNLWPKSV